MTKTPECTAKTGRHIKESGRLACPACRGATAKSPLLNAMPRATQPLPEDGEYMANVMLGNAAYSRKRDDDRASVMVYISGYEKSLTEEQRELVAIAVLDPLGDVPNSHPAEVVSIARDWFAPKVKDRVTLARLARSLGDEALSGRVARNPNMPATLKSEMVSRAKSLPDHRQAEVCQGMLDVADVSPLPDFVLHRMNGLSEPARDVVVGHKNLPEHLVVDFATQGWYDRYAIHAVERVNLDLTEDSIVRLHNFCSSLNMELHEEERNIVQRIHGRRLSDESLAKMAKRSSGPLLTVKILEHRDASHLTLDAAIVSLEALDEDNRGRRELDNAVHVMTGRLLSEALCDDNQRLSDEAVVYLEQFGDMWEMTPDSPEVVIAKTTFGTVEK